MELFHPKKRQSQMWYFIRMGLGDDCLGLLKLKVVIRLIVKKKKNIINKYGNLII